MTKRRGTLGLVVLLSAMALPVVPTRVAADDAKTSNPWVKVDDDTVIRATTLQAMNSAASRYQPLVAYGDGFETFGSRGGGQYTLRLVSGFEGDIEAYRNELQQTANEINAQTNIIMDVAPGTTPGPGNPLFLTAPPGEIWVMIASQSGCGSLGGGTLGCGGPDAFDFIDDEFRTVSGVVWLQPNMQAKYHQAVTNHEVGHALGLQHYNAQYLGQYQVMRSTTNGSFSAYRAGDVNGLRWLSEPPPLNDSLGGADLVCPLKDSTMSASNWMATKEAGEPAHAGSGPRRSVWFKYVAQKAGSTTFKTTNDSLDDFDTVIAVYSGSMFAGAVPVASNDDFTGVLSQVTFTAVIGTTYWIAVDGKGIARGETDVVFDLPEPPITPTTAVGVPARFLDTRRPGGQTFDCGDQAVGRIEAGTTYQLQVTNRAFVPSSNVASVTMNVTVVGPDAGGYLTVFPCGTTQPNASNLNFAAGDVIPNLVIAKVGAAGKVCFFTSATTDLLVDVSNYFLTSGPLTAISPARLLDTRAGGATADGAHAGVGRIPAGGTYELPVVSRGGVHASAVTVVLNVTAVGPSNGGYVTVYPCGAPQPNASNLNFVAGDTIPNLVIAKVGTAGKVCFFAEQQTDLLVDVNGYFLSGTGTSLVPLTAPARLLDTRPGGSTVDDAHEGVGRIPAGGTYVLPVGGRGLLPASPGQVVLNVTAVGPSTGGYITVYPCGSAQPNASNLNFSAGEIIPNSVIAKVGTGNSVCFFSSAATDLIVDVSGSFTP